MRDIRYAFRSLRATPIVSVVAVLSLALGIGANTAIFSVLDGLLLRSLPVREPQRLALLDNGSWTNPIWEQIRERRDLFDGAFAWSNTRFDVAKGGQTDFVEGIWASGAFFDVLGVPAILGRTFTESDDRRGGGPNGPVAVISHDFWQRRFGGAADVIGRQITLNRVSFTIVGVTPPGFYGLDVGSSYDVAIPLGCEPLISGADSTLDKRSSWWLDIFVRVKKTQTTESATAALRGVQPQIREATTPPDWPAKLTNEYLKEAFTLVPAATGSSSLRARYERALLTIMVVVALVLVIACANIANLLLARATARRHELGVRLALGATRWQLARLLLTESLLIAAAGTLLGLLFAQWASRLLVAQFSTQSNRVFLDLTLDWRVVGFTALAGAVTALLFGAIPALRAAQIQPGQALNAQARSIAGGSHLRLGNALVVVQVALSLMLVVAGMLFVRSFTRLVSVDLGFDRDPLLVATINAQQSGAEPAGRLAMYERVRQSAEAVPGVAKAALSVVTPVSRSTWQYQVEVPGGVRLPDRQSTAYVNFVTPGWLATYGTRLIAGRDFTPHDNEGAQRVAIVNEAFTRRFLNGASPLGRTVRQTLTGPGRPNPPIEIVGVARDAVYLSLRQQVPPTLYLPFAQLDETPSFARLTVRSAGPAPATLVRAVTSAAGRVDPQLALTFRSLSEYVNASLIQDRLVAMLAGFFSALALLLAGLGLYGVTAYAVSRRRAEIGIRMALGAVPGSVVRNVLGRVALLVGIGVGAGAVISGWLVRFVTTLLFGLEAHDPWTFVGAAVVLAAVGGLAAWLPARRAARIDPASVLRDA